MLSCLYSNSDTIGLGKTVVSPAVLVDTCYYKLWFVDNKLIQDEKTIAFSQSIDGKEWPRKVRCTFSGRDINPWHIDVQQFDSIYYMTIYEYGGDLSLWESDNMIDFRYVQSLLVKSECIGSFYNGLYKASLVKEEDKYRLYFSADDYENTYIGLMEGDDLNNMHIVSTSDGKFSSFVDFILKFYRHKRVKYTFIVNNFIRNIS